MSLKFANNNSLSAITSLPDSISGGAWTLLSTATADDSGTNLSFTSGIDSTYKEYIFKLINIHNATGNTGLLFNFSIDGGSNYNVTKTTTFFETHQKEDGTDTVLSYSTSRDLAQSTSDQKIGHDMGDGNDECLSGTLHLFDPSNTTFVKHFMSDCNNASHNDYSYRTFASGYGNTTSAINAITFVSSSGNIESGVIKLYGVS